MTAMSEVASPAKVPMGGNLSLESIVDGKNERGIPRVREREKEDEKKVSKDSQPRDKHWGGKPRPADDDRCTAETAGVSAVELLR